MQLGIGSWCFPWAIGISGYPLPTSPLSAERLVEKAHDLGLRVVQICDNYPLDELGESRLNIIYEIAKDTGVGIEVGTRGIEPSHLLKYLRIAKALHSVTVRTIIDSPVQTVRGLIEQVIPEYEKAEIAIAGE